MLSRFRRDIPTNEDERVIRTWRSRPGLAAGAALILLASFPALRNAIMELARRHNMVEVTRTAINKTGSLSRLCSPRRTETSPDAPKLTSSRSGDRGHR